MGEKKRQTKSSDSWWRAKGKPGMDMGGWVGWCGWCGWCGWDGRLVRWLGGWETHLKDRPTDEMTDSARVESLGESRVWQRQSRKIIFTTQTKLSTRRGSRGRHSLGRGRSAEGRGKRTMKLNTMISMKRMRDTHSSKSEVLYMNLIISTFK